MYTPLFQCHTCGIPMRYDGRCLKCLEPRRTYKEACERRLDKIEKTISTMNTRRHNGCDEWQLGIAGVDKWCVTHENPWLYENQSFTEMEAIAIAEWYERNPESK